MKAKYVVLLSILPSLLVGIRSANLETLAQKPSSVSAVVPKTWDETALADWATPVAGINVRPTQISAKEYYAMRVENLRTYPVYFPGREPAGYWEGL